MTPDQESRYAWNQTHDCHVCGAKAGFTCSMRCTREFGVLRSGTGPNACPARSAHIAALIELTKCICGPDDQAECCPQHGRFATLQEAWDAGREHERAMNEPSGSGPLQ